MKFTKILVTVSEEEAGESAFRLACQLSKENNARLYALHIIEVKQELPLDAEVDAAQGESVLSRIEAVGKQKKCKVEAGILQARHAGPAIVQEATERETGLIILGISFKRRFSEFTLGDTVSYVLENAPCPVILWHEQLGATPTTGSNHQGESITGG